MLAGRGGYTAVVSETWLVTGGAGFIGRAVVEELLVEADGPEVVVLDALTYAAHPGALRRLGDAGRLHVVDGDVADADAVSSLVTSCLPGVILHLASETHVDRAIRDVAPFVRTNVQGSWVVANAALGVGARLVQVSTDEVYGDRSGRDPAREGDPVSPSNPYAATNLPIFQRRVPESILADLQNELPWVRVFVRNF